jgi:hypothetical protein
MNNEQMKAEYKKNPDKWVPYFKPQIGQIYKCYDVDNVMLFDNQFIYIAKKDKKVADAVIANPDVEIEFKSQSSIYFIPLTHTAQFFENYNPNWKYQLAKPQCDGKETMMCMECGKEVVGNSLCEDCKIKHKDNYPELGGCNGFFNGGYIKASQEAYDLLVENGITVETVYEEDGVDWYFLIHNNHARYMEEGSVTYNKYKANNKQFYINNGALSWTEPTSANNAQVEPTTSKMETVQINSMEDEELTYEEAKKPIHGIDELSIVGEKDDRRAEIRNSVNNSNNSNDNLGNTELEQTISITDEDDKVYEFEKPEFEGELLKVVGIFIIGYTKEDLGAFSRTWDLSGVCVDSDIIGTSRDLTPIKKLWYEDESNFPCMMVSDVDTLFIVHTKQGVTEQIRRKWRLATQEERDSLHFDGKDN